MSSPKTDVKEGFAWKYNECNPEDDSYCIFEKEAKDNREKAKFLDALYQKVLKESWVSHGGFISSYESKFVPICNECQTKLEKIHDNPDSENTRFYCPKCKVGTL